MDENGIISSTPPDKKEKKDLRINNILLGARPIPSESIVAIGIISFYSDKGYGFITDDQTHDKIFFHNNDVLHTVKLKDKVSFEKKYTPRGNNAINLKKYNIN